LKEAVVPDDGWLELHKSRFADLPFDCGNEIDPGVLDTPELRDWSARPTTDDQYRIESYLDRLDLRTKRILHIGIGNSGLARRLHRRAGEIVGTSVDGPEIGLARSLSLPNYTAIEHNKYSGLSNGIPGKFDLIVDNNLTSSCCCISHLRRFFEFLGAKLSSDGQVITDSAGLAWIPPTAHPRWQLSFDDLAAVAKVAELIAYRIDRNILALGRTRPPKPRLLPSPSQLVMRTGLFGRKLIRTGRQAWRTLR
jgi:hypothetical protein